VFDLCEQAPQVDKKCPIEQGDFTANKTVQLPKDIPPVINYYICEISAFMPYLLESKLQGKYTVQAHITTEDERQITCITGSMVFKLNG
jgi:hypothetical protein